MSIAKMQKLTVIGVSSQKQALVDGLTKLGLVQIKSLDDILTDSVWEGYSPGDVSKEVKDDRADLKAVEDAIAVLTPYTGSKGGLFPEKINISDDQFDELAGKEKDLVQDARTSLNFYRHLGFLNEKENAANSEIQLLLPWIDYDLPVSEYKTQNVRTWQGVVQSGKVMDRFKAEFEEKLPWGFWSIVSESKTQTYLSVTFLSKEREAAEAGLRELEFNRIKLGLKDGTPAERIEALKLKFEENTAEKEKFKQLLTDKAAGIDDLKQMHDFLSTRLEKADVKTRILDSGSSFYLEGWYPRLAKDKVAELLRSCGCWFNAEDPDKGEDAPVLLLNGKFSEGFEAVTELYSLPRYSTIDATPLFAPFFALFFGIMLSDVAYGAILAGACFMLTKKYHPDGMLGKLLKMFFWCGLGTMFWGFMFGSFFGDVVTQIGTGFFGVNIAFPTLWFTPMNEPMKMLVLSCLLGLLHLFVGLGASGYMSIRDGHPWDAVCDCLFWYLLLLGLGGMLGGMFSASFPAAIANVCKYLAIAGAAGIVLTGGRHKKGIFGKLVGGVVSLYGITSYISDIFSYSRLLALGLATGVVSSVFNTLGTMNGLSIGGIIIFIIAFGIGHPYNFVINLLGSFVHTSRLQYVEFFGKFYEGDGEAFKPLRADTKYVKLIKEDN